MKGRVAIDFLKIIENLLLYTKSCMAVDFLKIYCKYKGKNDNDIWSPNILGENYILIVKSVPSENMIFFSDVSCAEGNEIRF